MTKLINPHEFNKCISVLRAFFTKKGFIEVHPQSAQSIMAACEDPETISTYCYGRSETGPTEWPLPQTGQMWLEHVLLDNPDIKGCFAVTTSYRNEPDPIPGRHETIFPMFEFEAKGTMNDLITMEKSLLQYIGFPKKYRLPIIDNDSEHDITEREHIYDSIVGLEPCIHGIDGIDGYYDIPRSATKFRSRVADTIIRTHNHGTHYPDGDYESVAAQFNTDDIEHHHENLLCEKEGPVFFLKNFPIYTSPFWNMKIENDIAKKVDVILHGQETIGSAERSCSPDEMRMLFDTISDGGYAKILYDRFGKDRINRELDEYFAKDFFPRYGGGIGVTRMIRAMKMSNLMSA